MSEGSIRRALARAAVATLALSAMVMTPGVAIAATGAPTTNVAAFTDALGSSATNHAAAGRPAVADAKDADDDAIPDVVEREVCGTATCALGTEDRDDDGIPDWTEVLSCDTTTCASPTKDADKDGIPDFAERLVCDTDTCSNSLEDADGDRIGDWVEFVICGSRTCADGSEDYDGNEVSDAAELAACVVRIDDLAITGGTVALWIIILALVLIGGGLGLWLWRRRRGARSAADEEGDEGSDDFGWDLGDEDDTDAATSDPVPDEEPENPREPAMHDPEGADPTSEQDR